MGRTLLYYKWVIIIMIIIMILTFLDMGVGWIFIVLFN
jgi:hypothetical protein